MEDVEDLMLMKRLKAAPVANEPRQNSPDVYDETDIAPVSVAEFGGITVVDRLAGMVEMLITRGDKKPTVPIESKILLTLDEAQALTGQ